MNLKNILSTSLEIIGIAAMAAPGSSAAPEESLVAWGGSGADRPANRRDGAFTTLARSSRERRAATQARRAPDRATVWGDPEPSAARGGSANSLGMLEGQGQASRSAAKPPATPSTSTTVRPLGSGLTACRVTAVRSRTSAAASVAAEASAWL